MLRKNKLDQLLTDPCAILAMDGRTLARTLGREVARMQGYAQNNPHHCYDLLTHTVKTVAGLDNFCEDKETLPLLRVAALLHDIGKPQVMRVKDGRCVYYGHAIRSAQISRPLLTELGYTTEETARILFFVAHHDDFISFKLPEELQRIQSSNVQMIGEQTVRGQLSRMLAEARKRGEHLPTKADLQALLALCCADVSAQSERAVIHGRLVDNRAQKLRRCKAILQIVERIAIEAL